jgi:hypothetical protein
LIFYIEIIDPRRVKKTAVIAVLLVVLAGLAYSLSRPKATSPTELNEGRRLLVNCQQSNDAASPACEQARTSLSSSCSQGVIHACDVIFQADELVPIRKTATEHLERFCGEQKPQACKTFEVALRNWIDLDRKAGTPDPAARLQYRAKYVKAASENCDRGYYFSCLAVLDEDRSTATPESIQSAEKKIQSLCAKATDRFEREDCLSFSEYLALSNRQTEGEKFAAQVCAEGSETGCLSVLRIQINALSKSDKSDGLTAEIQKTCADSKKGALLMDYCKAFAHAIETGATTWSQLKKEPALLESAHKVSFEELLTIKPREVF